MPSLVRLLAVVCVIAALVYGVMLAMVTFIHPAQRDIVQTVPLPKLPK